MKKQKPGVKLPRNPHINTLNSRKSGILRDKRKRRAKDERKSWRNDGGW